MIEPDPAQDGELLLSLLNSTPVVSGVPTDTLVDPEQSARWAQSHGGTGASAELNHVRQLRDTLQAVVRGDTSGDALQPYFDAVRLRPSLGADVPDVTWHLEVPDAQRLASRAALAWAHIQERMPGRLKPCANDQCRLFLLDRTKANTARWCSMAVCGNRMKAQRHYRRQQTDRP